MTRRITGRSLRHPERYREMFHIARKYQLYRVAKELGSHRLSDEEGKSAMPSNGQVNGTRQAENFASALEELGPCFIKLGQLLSTRPDLLPPDYIAALARLQDCVAPIPGSETLSIVESELGGAAATFFSEFDCQPVAAASMAQVHRAVLVDGAIVAVKILRPGIRRRIEVDLEVLHDLVRFAVRHKSLSSFGDLEQMVHELDGSLRSEMDYFQELENTIHISRQLSGFQLLMTPEVYRQFSTSRVLTLSFVQGQRLSNLSPKDLELLDGEAIAKELLSAYLQQIVVDGSFHCDPHPGNILMTETGRLALLDFGMIGRFDMEEKDTIIQLLLAFAERRGRRVADIYLDMLELSHIPNRKVFIEDVEGFVSRYHDLSGGRMGLGTAFLELAHLATSHGIPVPSIWMLLVKAILNLDGVLSLLSPRLDPVKLIREYMVEVIQKRVWAESSAAVKFSWGLDVWNLLKNAPRRADALLGKLVNDQLTVQLHMSPLEEARQDLNRAVNRLSQGMLLGSLIISCGYVLGSWLRTERSDRSGRDAK
jgi:predicted unusual protein kinase regulating ubiquinone biosynthesis (AarF/ABC1/UbiB family)